jgi:RNA polymerase sigma-70 factor (ECF subfamily)
LNDHGLIARIIKRDQQALADLYARYSRPVFNLAQRVAQDRSIAEEVTQDVFMLVWKHPAKWNPDKGRLASWLLTVTRYMTIDRIRKEQREPASEATPLESVSHRLDAHVSPTAMDDAQVMRSILRRLPREQQQVILLAYYRGMTHSDIATHLGIPEGTVKSRLRLGLEKLRRYWKSSVKEPG